MNFGKNRIALAGGGRRELRDDAFQRLVGLLGEIGVEPRDLLRLRNERLISGLREFGLHFERLVQRLHARQLLDKRLGVFKRLLGVVAIGAGDGLKAVLNAGRGGNDRNDRGPRDGGDRAPREQRSENKTEVTDQQAPQVSSSDEADMAL